MSGSNDDRIKRFVEKSAAGAQQRAELSEQAVARRAETRAQWRNASNTLEQVLDELHKKLGPAGFRYQSMDNGPAPGYIATTRVHGKLAQRSFEIMVHVQEDGTIVAVKTGHQKPRGGSDALSIFTATSDQYEKLLLDLLGVPA